LATFGECRSMVFFKETPPVSCDEILVPNSYKEYVRISLRQLAYFVNNRIFQIDIKIGELLGSYQEDSAKSVGKQGGEILI
jgi:hypothetical protein